MFTRSRSSKPATTRLGGGEGSPPPSTPLNSSHRSNCLPTSSSCLFHFSCDFNWTCKPGVADISRPGSQLCLCIKPGTFWLVSAAAFCSKMLARDIIPDISCSIQAWKFLSDSPGVLGACVKNVQTSFKLD